MRIQTTCIFVALAGLTGPALADTIVFKNGDKLTGTIQTLDSQKLKITGTLAGDVAVKLADVATFSSDKPLKIETTDGTKIEQKVFAAEDGTIRPTTGQPIALANIQKLNPIPPKWTGSLLLNGELARGNTNTANLGFTFAAEHRRNDEINNDRLTLGAAYNLGRERDPSSGDTHTTSDNWFVAGKYDRFWTQKLYGYVDGKFEHDRVAELNYRVTPGVGIGYQWVETPELNFRTEVGVTYVYEDFITDGTTEHLAARLAYHFDKKLNDRVKLFNNFEILPGFEDPSDYNLTADAGIRVEMTKNWFSEFKVQWVRDNTPAPEAVKDDLRYVLGIGYAF